MADRQQRTALQPQLLWIFANVVGWAASPYLLQVQGVSDLTQIGGIATSIAVRSIPLGVALAIGGALGLRPSVGRPYLWAVVCIAAYPIAMAAAFLLEAASLYWRVHSMGMALTGEGGDAFFVTSPLIDLLLAGLMLGAAQLPTFRQGFASTAKTRLLWMAGFASSWPLAWFLSAPFATTADQSLLRGAVMGMAAATMALGVLAVLDRASSA